jgi:hypothetical protein
MSVVRINEQPADARDNLRAAQAEAEKARAKAAAQVARLEQAREVVLQLETKFEAATLAENSTMVLSGVDNSALLFALLYSATVSWATAPAQRRSFE